MLEIILAALGPAASVVATLSKLAKDNGASDDEIRAAIEKSVAESVAKMLSDVAADKAEELLMFPENK